MRLQNVLEKSQNLLFLVFPAVLILKPRLAINVFTIFLLLLSLGHVYLNKKLIITFYEKFLLIFLSALLISIIFKSVDSHLGEILFKRHLRWLFYPTLIGQLNIKKEDIKNIIISVSIGILGYAVRFSKELLSLKDSKISYLEFFKSSLPWNHRYLSDYDIPQSALILGATLVILYYVINVMEDKKYKKYLIFLLIIDTITFLGLQSRGMTLVLIILTFLLAVIRKEKIFKIFSGTLAIFVLLLGLYFSNSSYMKRYENIANDTSFHARREVHREAIRIFKNHKLIGVGFHNFSAAQDKRNYKYLPEYEDPHNQPLKLLCETGIIGFASYYMLMGSILLVLWKKYKENKYYLVGILTLLSLLMFENIECMFKSVQSLPYIFFILSICLNKCYKDKIKAKMSEIFLN